MGLKVPIYIPFGFLPCEELGKFIFELRGDRNPEKKIMGPPMRGIQFVWILLQILTLGPKKNPTVTSKYPMIMAMIFLKFNLNFQTYSGYG